MKLIVDDEPETDAVRDLLTYDIRMQDTPTALRVTVIAPR